MVAHNLLLVIAFVVFLVAVLLPVFGGSEGRLRLVPLGLCFWVAALLAAAWGLP